LWNKREFLAPSNQVGLRTKRLSYIIYLTVVVKLGSDFVVVSWAEAILANELLLEDDDKRIYSVEEAAKVFEMLTTSKTGYLSYEVLCRLLGKKKVEALIAQNVLHYRPKSDFARDLIPYPTEPVLTATSAAHQMAMKLVLERFKSRSVGNELQQ